MTDSITPAPESEQTAQLVARVRRLMIIAALTMSVGIGAVFIVIGYRVFNSEGSAATATHTVTLPKGAKITASAVSGDHLVLTLDINGTPEIHTFDIRSLRRVGRLTFASEP